MRLGMVGLGRMGANMAMRLVKQGHELHVFSDRRSEVQALGANGAKGATSLEALVEGIPTPRAIWLMVPAAAVDSVLSRLETLLTAGDVIIDGGNSYYRDDLHRAHKLQSKGLHYIDVGVSGGVWGLERGYCQMIGGESAIIARLDPIFRSLAPGIDSTSRTPGATGTPTNAEQGYLHCGGNGAGHFVKMVHNGIEYGLMAALAEGLGILKKANSGRSTSVVDAETTPMRHPEFYCYDFDIAQIAEVWRRGSVVSSWLLDLAASALRKSPELDGFSGRVSDSGEGRWTLQAAIDEGVPAPAIASALFSRFNSRGEGDYADKVLSALRLEFGGHVEQHVKG